MSKKTRPTKRAPRSPGNSGPMDIHLLQQLTKMMTDADLSAVELRDGEKRIVLRRGAEVVMGPASSGYAPQPAPSQALAPGPAAPKAAVAEDTDAGLVSIKSPMVGTFYAASSPDARPFVSVGSSVDEETDVCIIEAMKVFNNIKAETRGTIAKVLVTNGQTVEFGQTLFLVKPS